MRRTTFIGHRQVFGKGVFERIKDEIEKQIKLGCKKFTMGTHGDFDRLALSACRSLRKKYPDIEIEVVITSLNAIKKDSEFSAAPYDDVKTVIYVIDGCDTLICYVDERVYRSGAKTAMRYAEKHGLKIINLYREEDLPFYGMTKEQIDEYWRGTFEENNAERF